MAYRKITVNDKTYEYVVGKTHTKIKGVGVVENIKISLPLYFEPCYDPIQEWVVTPGSVKNYILSQGA